MLATSRRRRTRECGTDEILYGTLAWRFLSRLTAVPSWRWPEIAAAGDSSRRALDYWHLTLTEEDEVDAYVLAMAASKFVLRNGFDVEDFVLTRAGLDGLHAVVGAAVCLAWDKTAIPPPVRTELWAPFVRWGDA